VTVIEESVSEESSVVCDVVEGALDKRREEEEEAIKQALTDFNSARKADLPNEKRPLAEGEKYSELKSSSSSSRLLSTAPSTTSHTSDDSSADSDSSITVTVTGAGKKEEKAQEKGKK